MYMLEHWFSGQNPSSIIQSGDRSITNARLFTDDLQLDDNCVYVGRTIDFFSSSTSPEIMMMHKNDMISITSTDLNAVFNEVLSMFDYYSKIEQLLYASIFKPEPEQCILSSCEHLVGPMFIMTPDFRILACSQNFSGQYVNSFWDTFATSKEPTLDMVVQMQNSNAHKLMQTTPYMTRFSEPNAAPYSHGIISAYLHTDGQVIGHLVLASMFPITHYDQDIMSLILDALNLLQAGSGKQDRLSALSTSEDALLTKLISGIDPVRTEQYLTALYNLSEQNYYCFAIADSVNVQAYNLTRKTYQQILQMHFRNCISTKTKTHIIFLLWSDKSIMVTDIHRLLSGRSDSANISWGISNPFHSLDVAHIFYEQAIYALTSKAQQVTLFHSRAVGYILGNQSNLRQMLARHPIISELERNPAETSTELLHTLREYLLCERSVKKAAERMYLHRNTINYRIDQIKAMQMLDFDDPYDRMYCSISLLLGSEE